MSLPDPTKLSTAILISNMVHATDMYYRKQCVEELDKRLPQKAVDSSPVLETVEEEKSSTLKTQNFVAPTIEAAEQPLLEIEADFEDVWNTLVEATKYIESARMKGRLLDLANMFQNPATIKPKAK